MASNYEANCHRDVAKKPKNVASNYEAIVILQKTFLSIGQEQVPFRYDLH